MKISTVQKPEYNFFRIKDGNFINSGNAVGNVIEFRPEAFKLRVNEYKGVLSVEAWFREAENVICLKRLDILSVLKYFGGDIKLHAWEKLNPNSPPESMSVLTVTGDIEGPDFALIRSDEGGVDWESSIREYLVREGYVNNPEDVLFNHWYNSPVERSATQDTVPGIDEETVVDQPDKFEEYTGDTRTAGKKKNFLGLSFE